MRTAPVSVPAATSSVRLVRAHSPPSHGLRHAAAETLRGLAAGDERSRRVSRGRVPRDLRVCGMRAVRV